MKKNIANTIRKQIQSGTLSMRSSVSIWAEKLGIGSGLILLLLVLIFLMGSILYWNSINSELLYPGYGGFGIRSYLESFPYLLVILFVFFFILGSFLLRKYDFSYKQPFMLILSVVLGAVLLLGWATLFAPGGKQFYRQQGKRLYMRRQHNASVVVGYVQKITANSFIIQEFDDALVNVIINPSTHFPFGVPKVGSNVRVVGVWDSNSFKAFGVKIIQQ